MAQPGARWKVNYMIKDLRDWKKESERKNRNKHQWGWFQHPNAGNVKYNIDFFNHVTGADGGDTSVLAGSVGDGGMGESLSMNDTVELYYDDIEVSGYYGPTDWETGYPEKEYNETVSWVYTVDRDDIFVDLEEFIAEESPELSDGQLEMIVSENFDELVDKYYQQLLDKYRKYAEEEANEKYEYDEYDHYLDAIGESVNIREALNKIDCNTCGKYDLLNMYDCSDMPVEKKAKLAEMLKENVSADKLYEYMDEESPWQIGLELFADNGHEYKVISVIDEREVDGYELSIVGAIGNELSNADEEVYFVLLDSDIEWGPVDTAEEAIEWASDVRDGYYSDDEDYEEEWPDADDDIDFIDLYGVHGEYDDDYDVQTRHSMKEDTVKQGKNWVNKGKAGTHGKFATKKEADAQRKAMFASGYKGEGLEEAADAILTKDSEQLIRLFAKLLRQANRNRDAEALESTDFTRYPDKLRQLNMIAYDFYEAYNDYARLSKENRPNINQYLKVDQTIENVMDLIRLKSAQAIKEACRRGNAMNEGAMKEIDLEVQEAGGVDAYIDSLESQLRNISREMRFLRGQARREMKAGGAYDSVDEINDALKATEREYNEVRKKYDYISSQQTGGVN